MTAGTVGARPTRKKPFSSRVGLAPRAADCELKNTSKFTRTANYV